jgi:hypothetical protein
MKITQVKAINLFQKKADSIVSVFSKKWQGHKFHKLKQISTTEKGDMGEDFLALLLNKCGYKNIEVVKGRRGHYDVAIKDSNNKNIIEFEVKVATEDVNSHFQFNGIRYDTKYTHLFCFAVLPNDIGYLIIDKNDLNKESMVSMAKNSNASFKLTKNKNSLSSFDDFCDDMAKITNGLI